MVERELKAVLADPDRVRAALTRAGAKPTFSGRMADRRFDRDGMLMTKDEVLRIRTYRSGDGSSRAVIGWKGPVSVEAGYKLRVEHEVATDDGEAAFQLVTALGYGPVYAIDRYVEYYSIAGATVRLEWYPRMDPLIEVEGSADAIEAAVAATGIPRDAFTSEVLDAFLARYERRTGTPPAVAIRAGLDLPEPTTQ